MAGSHQPTLCILVASRGLWDGLGPVLPFLRAQQGRAVLQQFPSALPRSHGDVVTAVCSLSVTLGQILSLAETLCPSLSLCSATIKEHFPVPVPGDVLGAGGVEMSHSLCSPPLSPIHPFDSIEKISKITSPVLIIHGTEDEVIDFSHGLALFERCPKAVEPLWVDGAGHNDIELYSQYLERLRKFISQELASQRN